MSKASFTIEMFWKCPCGVINPGMKGAERDSFRCVTCGREKTAAENWLMPDHPEQQDPLTGELARKARDGNAWYCSFCRAASRADSVECEVCSAPRGPLSGATPSKAAERLEGAVPGSVGPRNAVPPPPRLSQAPLEDASTFPRAASVQPDVLWNQPPLRYRVWKTYALCALVLVISGVLGWFFILPKKALVRVALMDWSRTVLLQTQRDLTGEDWQDEEPPGVYHESCEVRQRGTKDCHPHECLCGPVPYACHCIGGTPYVCNCHTVCKSNHNGSATCSTQCSSCTTPRSCSTCYRRSCTICYDQCPSYENWCSYRFHRWDTVEEHTLTRADALPQWPEETPSLRAAALQDLPQRVQHRAVYHVRFVKVLDESQRWDLYPEEAAFLGFRVGQRWQATWYSWGGFKLIQKVD